MMHVYLKPLKMELVQVLFFLFINMSVIRFVYVLTSVPFIPERYSKNWTRLHISAKIFGEK